MQLITLATPHGLLPSLFLLVPCARQTGCFIKICAGLQHDTRSDSMYPNKKQQQEPNTIATVFQCTAEAT